MELSPGIDNAMHVQRGCVESGGTLIERSRVLGDSEGFYARDFECSASTSPGFHGEGGDAHATRSSSIQHSRMLLSEERYTMGGIVNIEAYRNTIIGEKRSGKIKI